MLSLATKRRKEGRIAFANESDRLNCGEGKQTGRAAQAERKRKDHNCTRLCLKKKSEKQSATAAAAARDLAGKQPRFLKEEGLHAGLGEGRMEMRTTGEINSDN